MRRKQLISKQILNMKLVETRNQPNPKSCINEIEMRWIFHKWDFTLCASVESPCRYLAMSNLTVQVGSHVSHTRSLSTKNLWELYFSRRFIEKFMHLVLTSQNQFQFAHGNVVLEVRRPRDRSSLDRATWICSSVETDLFSSRGFFRLT